MKLSQFSTAVFSTGAVLHPHHATTQYFNSVETSNPSNIVHERPMPASTTTTLSVKGLGLPHITRHDQIRPTELLTLTQALPSPFSTRPVTVDGGSLVTQTLQAGVTRPTRTTEPDAGSEVELCDYIWDEKLGFVFECNPLAAAEYRVISNDSIFQSSHDPKHQRDAECTDEECAAENNPRPQQEKRAIVDGGVVDLDHPRVVRIPTDPEEAKYTIAICIETWRSRTCGAYNIQNQDGVDMLPAGMLPLMGENVPEENDLLNHLLKDGWIAQCVPHANKDECKWWKGELQGHNYEDDPFSYINRRASRMTSTRVNGNSTAATQEKVRLCTHKSSKNSKERYFCEVIDLGLYPYKTRAKDFTEPGKHLMKDGWYAKCNAHDCEWVQGRKPSVKRTAVTEQPQNLNARDRLEVTGTERQQLKGGPGLVHSGKAENLDGVSRSEGVKDEDYIGKRLDYPYWLDAVVTLPDFMRQRFEVAMKTCQDTRCNPLQCKQYGLLPCILPSSWTHLSGVRLEQAQVVFATMMQDACHVPSTVNEFGSLCDGLAALPWDGFMETSYSYPEDDGVGPYLDPVVDSIGAPPPRPGG